MRTFEDLGLERQNIALPFQKEEWFYHLKDGSLYPYYKEDIQKIDIFDIEAIKLICKDMDYPFFIDQWLSLIKVTLERHRSIKSIFGKYIAKMRLFSFKECNYIMSEEYDFICTGNEEERNKEIYHLDFNKYAIRPKVTFEIEEK